MEQQKLNYYVPDELDEELTIDLKKIVLAFWNRKKLLVTVFTIVLLYFITSTYWTTKKWTVDADLYINKANSTNYVDINPYAIEESVGLASVLSNQNPLADELELIQSPLVLNKVIQDNDLRFGKLFGFIPTKKTGEYLTTEKFLKSKLSFENKKGTHIVNISYTNKNKDIAYNVVNSIIANYIELHKEINSEKSKSDKKIIESEYKKVKADLNKKVSSAGGLPISSLSGTGQLAAMSAFSQSAQNAMSNLKGQYLAGEKSRVEIGEEEAKVTQLASKLEWAKMVEEMSDSSKVLVIKEPTIPRDWEYASPNLMINIIVGIIMGAIFAFWAVVISEIKDKKLTYMNLGENIIYNLEKEFKHFCAYLITNKNKKILFAFCGNTPTVLGGKFKQYTNISIVQAGITDSFSSAIQDSDEIVLFAQLGQTPSEDYKIIKNMIKENNKQISYEVLI